MFRTFDKRDASALTKQHNIMAFVGNGFDIQILASLKSPVRSDYASFYRFLQMRRFGEANVIVRQMAKMLEEGRKDWSDLEAALEQCISGYAASLAQVESDLADIQSQFSEFLNGVVTSDLLEELNRGARHNQWSRNSLAAFLYDLESEGDYDRLEFPCKTDHYHLFNFLFVNFNYTPLLDNYLYLDQMQFDPHPHSSADRNFGFYPNPRMFGAPASGTQTRWSSYINVEVIHPHGYQDIPRSILFGINDGGARGAQRLSKPYWARAEFKYSRYFESADLFVIFGCSMGRTDAWWWRHIYSRVRDGGADAILYWWNPDAEKLLTEDAVRAEFRQALDRDVADVEWALVAPRIHVISYSDATGRIWLTAAPSQRSWG